MESWGHMTTIREIGRGEDSPVEKCNTRVEGIRDNKRVEKQVSNDQSPHIEEQNGSKGGVLQQ